MSVLLDSLASAFDGDATRRAALDAVLRDGLPGPRTEAGARENIRVAAQYIAAWLSGRGAVPLYNLMEDAATASPGKPPSPSSAAPTSISMMASARTSSSRCARSATERSRRPSS